MFFLFSGLKSRHKTEVARERKSFPAHGRIASGSKCLLFIVIATQFVLLLRYLVVHRR